MGAEWLVVANPKEHAYLPLEVVRSWEGEAKAGGVSEVARGPGGFLAAYKKAGGDPRRLSPAWRAKREAFLARHMAQVVERNESLMSPHGAPTRRLLALVMWAFSPVKIGKRGGRRANPDDSRGDAQLRTLERAVRDDPSDVNAKARLIAARIRAGLTTGDRVLTAARLGDEAARLVKPRMGDWPECPAAGVVSALRDRREAVSFACDCAERILPAFERTWVGDVRQRRAVEAIREWIASPSDETVAAVASAADKAATSSAETLTAATVAHAASAVSAEDFWLYVAAAVAVIADAGGPPEEAWQRARMAKYLVGDVTLPPPVKASKKRRANPDDSRGDAQIRTLERAFAADPSDVGAKAHLLNARIRAGLTTHARVVMAARLGDQAARLAAPEWAALGDVSLDSGSSQGAIFALSDKREIVAFACDCAERVLPLFEQAVPGDMRPRRALEAARSWIETPSTKTGAYADGAYDASDAYADTADAFSAPARSAVAAASAAAAAAASGTFAASNEAAEAATAGYAAAYAVARGTPRERLWQCAQLAARLVGDVTLPPPVKASKKRRATNPDDIGDALMRRLEREAAEGDELAAARLEREQIRRGLRPPARRYLDDLAHEVVPEGHVTRKVHAVGIRAVLKAIGLAKRTSVKVPVYSMASVIYVAGPGGGYLAAEDARTIGAVFGVDSGTSAQDDRPIQYIGMYPSNREDRSDAYSDYFRPAGPSLHEDFWEVYKAGIRRGLEGKRTNPDDSRGDAQLRTLERAVRADPSDVGAKAHLLVAQIRVGLKARERVVMAARLGDEAARLAAPEWEALGEIDFSSVAGAQEALGALGDRRETVSFACDCAERVLPIFETRRSPDQRPRLALAAARAWIASPSKRTEAATFVAGDAAHASSGSGGSASGAAARSAAYAASSVFGGSAINAARAAGYARDAAEDAAEDAASDAYGIHGATSADAAHAVSAVGDAAIDETVAWQRVQLIARLLGDVTPPPPVKASKKRSTNPCCAWRS